MQADIKSNYRVLCWCYKILLEWDLVDYCQTKQCAKGCKELEQPSHCLSGLSTTCWGARGGIASGSGAGIRCGFFSGWGSSCWNWGQVWEAAIIAVTLGPSITALYFTGRKVGVSKSSIDSCASAVASITWPSITTAPHCYKSRRAAIDEVGWEWVTFPVLIWTRGWSGRGIALLFRQASPAGVAICGIGSTSLCCKTQALKLSV